MANMEQLRRDVTIQEVPMGTRQPIKVIFIGMGASGVNFCKKLSEKTLNVDLVVYEKNKTLGGTWYENQYEGCACDIPSVCYQFTWDRKPDWASYYSGSAQIHQYLEDLSDKYDLRRYVKFEHEIVKAEWLSEEGLWEVTIKHGSETFKDRAEFLINGGGVLNKWRWPKIKGIDAQGNTPFRGKLMHSARWDKSYDLTDKKVLNIGIGSSGVQIIPNIVDRVEQLHVVARSPVWITMGFAQTWAAQTGGNFKYSEEIKQRFVDDPEFYQRYCKAIESELNVRFKLIIKNTPESKAAKEFSINEMTRKLGGRKDLIDNLMPKDFDIGCRRPTPGNGFLEALTQDKTTVHFGEIQEITENGYVDKNGVEHEVDCIICATGFDTSFKPGFPILFDGKNLQDQFTGDIVGYLGLSSPEIPNYFIFIGAYGPLGHGSVMPMIEFYTDYVFQVLEKVQTEYIKRLSVKRSAAEDFTRYADKYLQRTAWNGPCSSWFKNGKTANKPVLWPGSRIHYLTVLEKPRYEHFDIEYKTDNSFSFLGDGFCTRELDGRDLTWYMGLLNPEEEGDKQPGSFTMDMEDGGGKFTARQKEYEDARAEKQAVVDGNATG
ncbi:related to monooxigenase [Ramularia collo-cygni]|uniref:Related to monooxigenase n=1 Tax=Ramularia collo-cygni TaxID=112498 RepID=A0A2D3UUM0_9PEZI|nr:related to monooxigenase [Ramularia collo-cygni]CZT14616.1 related to monooxigenase [Ramularia collo-cygni]